MDGSELLVWLQERGVDFRLPELLWTLLLVPLMGILLGVARSQRRRVADSFRVVRPGARRRRAPGTFVRLFALSLLLLSVGGMIVGFARPVVPLVTPDDAATVVFVVDGSM